MLVIQNYNEPDRMRLDLTTDRQNRTEPNQNFGSVWFKTFK